MLYQEATCKVCGRPILVAYRKVLCGDPTCDDEYRRDVQRRNNWREHHGDEPYPYPRYRLHIPTCGICGKPVRHPRPNAKFCAGWCHKVAQSNRMARYYAAHRDEVLARQRRYIEACKRQAASR